MSILAQCGYGRANKIEEALNSRIIDGFIMSPIDEAKERLENAIDEFASNYPNTIRLFDPQFYVSILPDPRDARLNNYDYYFNNPNIGLNRTDFTPSRIRNFVERCINYQHSQFRDRLSYIISPTILFDDFNDSWSQIAISMAQESIDFHNNLEEPSPLLISFVIAENAFSSVGSLNEFLNVITQFDVDGYYLLINRNSNNLLANYDVDRLTNLIYFCYVLGELNRYTIVSGYTDLYGFLLEAVGVNYTASGWSQGLKFFNLSRFNPSTGGQQASKRYTSTSLLTHILINPDMQDIFMVGLLQNILSSSAQDQTLINGPLAGEANWTPEISCLHYWHCLTDLSEQIAQLSNVTDKINEAVNIMRRGISRYAQLNNQGVNLEPNIGPNHLNVWLNAIHDFRTNRGI